MSLPEIIEVLDPCIAWCVSRGLANYSAIAREYSGILSRLKGGQVTEAALKMALIRWRGVAEKGCFGDTCSKLLEVLAKTRVELREGIGVVTVRKGFFEKLRSIFEKLLVEARLFHLLQGVTSFTVIVDEEHIDEIRGAAGEGILDEVRGQTAIILVSPREILETPGFVAYISTLLAINGVNITQIVSCYTDTVIVLPAQEAEKAYRLIHEGIRIAKKLLEMGDEEG